MSHRARAPRSGIDRKVSACHHRNASLSVTANSWKVIA